MENIIGFLSKCFESAYPPVLEQFLEYVKDLEFDTDPDYEVCSTCTLYTQCMTFLRITLCTSGNHRDVQNLYSGYGEITGGETGMDKAEEERSREEEN